MTTFTLQHAHDLCRLLSDGTRLRFLALLEGHALTVAELTEITGLAQSRVSTHLGRLREAGLVQLQKSNGASIYRVDGDGLTPEVKAIWSSLRKNLDDPTLKRDTVRAEAMVAARSGERTWADSVAGQMARHYSPGRTFETYTRGLGTLLDLGDVLDVASGDGVVAELIHHQAKSVTCLDISINVVRAGQERLGHLPSVRFVEGDMHTLPFDDATFDQILLMNALTYAKDADRVIAECTRTLRPGGRLVLTTLAAHPHEDVVSPYNHFNQGFTTDQILGMLQTAKLDVHSAEITHEERRAPHFRIITAAAAKTKRD